MTIGLSVIELGSDLRYGAFELQRRPGWQHQGGRAFRLVRRRGDQAVFQELRPYFTDPRNRYEIGERLLIDLLLRFPAAEFSSVLAYQGNPGGLTVRSHGLLLDPAPVLRAARIVPGHTAHRSDGTYEWTAEGGDALSPAFVDAARRVATVLAVLDEIVLAGEIVVDSYRLIEEVA